MNKTIIAIYGRTNEGKSSTIKEVCKILIANFPNAIPSLANIDYSNDLLLSIQLGSFKIGFESQGDPNSRLIFDDTLRKLAIIKLTQYWVDAILLFVLHEQNGIQ